MRYFEFVHNLGLHAWDIPALVARRERKAHAGGACKGSGCKRNNGFAGSRCCLIDFTHNYTLWRFFKKYLKTT